MNRIRPIRATAFFCAAALALFTSLSTVYADAMAHWTFDYAPIGPQKDSYPDMIRQRNAAIESKTAVVPYAGNDAPFGKALMLTGQTGSALSLPSMGPFFNKSFTLAAWINVKDGSHPNYLLADWPSPSNSFAFGTNFDTKTKRIQLIGDMRSVVIPKKELQPNGKKRHTLSAIRNLSDKDFTLDTWHHVAWVYNRTGPAEATLTTYLDGEEAGTSKFKPGAEVKSAEVLHNGGPIKIGFKQDTSMYFNGAIDEVWLFDNPLTSAQIANLMHTNDINKDGPAIVRAAPTPKPAEQVAVVTPTPKPAEAMPANDAPKAPTPTNVTPTPPTAPEAVAAADDAPVADAPVADAPVAVPAPAPAPTVARAASTDSSPTHVKTVAIAPPSKFTPGRIAGIATSSTIAVLLSGFLMWAKGERAKMKTVRA